MVLEDCLRMGVHSVSNIGPSICYVDHDSEIYQVLTAAGITLDNEIELPQPGARGDDHHRSCFPQEDSIASPRRPLTSSASMPARPKAD